MVTVKLEKDIDVKYFSNPQLLKSDVFWPLAPVILQK